jgi:flagellar biosynthesis regulator FlbT
MSFVSKLREKKKTLKKSSQDTYIRNIKRLRRVKNELPIPDKDHKWLLSKGLISWYDTQPLSVRRHMSNAANIALSVYGKESKEWKSRQRKSMEEFDESRRKRELTPQQKARIPAKGFDSIKKVVAQMKKELKHVINNTETLSDLLRVQNLVILSLYYEFPLRLDYATLKTERSKSTNSIYKNLKKPAGWHISLHEFKTAKSLGSKTFRFGPGNQRLLNKFIPAVKKITKHGFLLTNKKGGAMSKQVLSKTLMKITKRRIGKGFSTQLLRILYAMKNRDVIESAKQVSEKLMHSQDQSLLYAKKSK